jgi:hypothetical protein
VETHRNRRDRVDDSAFPPVTSGLLLCARPCRRVTTPHSTIPTIGTEPIPTPTEAAKVPTQTEMRNVDFHVDETTIMKIHQLRGEMVSKQPGTPLNFDNKTSFILKIDRAKIR